MVQCRELSSPTSEAQASQLAGALRSCQPHGVDNCGKNVTGVLDFSLFGELSETGVPFLRNKQTKRLQHPRFAVKTGLIHKTAKKKTEEQISDLVLTFLKYKFYPLNKPVAR